MCFELCFLPLILLDLKSGLKNNIKQQVIPKPQVAVTAAGILDVIDQFDQVTFLLFQLETAKNSILCIII